MKSEKDKIQNFNKKLKRYSENRDFIKVCRETTHGTSYISGFLLNMSEKFLLIQKEEEFYLNGYIIIPNGDFFVRCNKFEKAFRKILVSEGILEKDFGINEQISLESWEFIFKDLKYNDIHVIVECENLANPSFIIGPITEINKKSVSIRYYDGTGKYNKKSVKVKYKDITILTFSDRYSTVFRKYLKEKEDYILSGLLK